MGNEPLISKNIARCFCGLFDGTISLLINHLVYLETVKMSEFNETKVILHELEQLYNRDDDIKDVLDIRKMQNEVEAQCAVRLKDAKEIIKGISS
jgi:hypothetical protein